MTMQTMQQQDKEYFENPLRTVRLQLTKPQIELLVAYALRNGYQRRNPNVKIDMTEQNAIARHGIMLRLGFSENE
jgi:hypothetical protein